MKNRTPLLIILGVVLGLGILMLFYSANRTDWTLGWKYNQKKPHGAYIIYHSLKSLFPNSEIETHNSLILNPSNSKLINGTNIFIKENLTSSENLHSNIFALTAQGGVFFIAANSFSVALLDTLGLSQNWSNYYYIENKEQLTEVTFTFHTYPFVSQKFHFKGELDYNTFNVVDSLHTIIHVTDNQNQPVLIEKQIGEGRLILCSFPYAFSNYYLLNPETRKFATRILSLLPDRKVHWIEAIRSSYLTSDSPYRFLMSNTSIKSALILALIGVILFVLFRGKRIQSVIPIINKPRNTTLDFVYSIGLLYYNNGNHNDLIYKQFQLWRDQVYLKYRIHLNPDSEENIQALSAKSGVDVQVLKDICTQFLHYKQNRIGTREVIKFHKLIHSFYTKQLKSNGL